MATISELRKEAKDLGIKTDPKMTKAELEELIENYYASQETNEKLVQQQVEEKEAEELEGEQFVSKAEKKLIDKKTKRLQKAKDAEMKARETIVVEIVDNDPKYNAHTTTCTVTCANEFFELGTIILPLNTPVEVSRGHINVLKETKYVHHVIDHKTGLNKPELRNRYTISYVQNKV